MRNILLFPLIVLIALAVDGCGYHLPSGAALPPAVAGKTVRIPIFGNKSFRANLEAVVTNHLIDEFSLHPAVTVITTGEGDLSLAGEVTSYDLAAISYSAADVEKEYRATITVQATLRQTSNQKIIWKGTVSSSQTFPANANIALQQNSEDAAIQEASRLLAQRLYINIADGF